MGRLTPPVTQGGGSGAEPVDPTQFAGPWKTWRCPIGPTTSGPPHDDTPVPLTFTECERGFGGAPTLVGGVVELGETYTQNMTLSWRINLTTDAAPGQAEAYGRVVMQSRPDNVSAWVDAGDGVLYEIDETDEDELVGFGVVQDFVKAGTQFRLALYSFPTTPAGIVLELTEGYLYWTLQGSPS